MHRKSSGAFYRVLLSGVAFLTAVCSGIVLFGQEAGRVSDASLESLEQVVEQYVAKNFALGAELLVIQGDQVRLHKSFGMADRESEQSWKNDTLCNIRSMTKPVTSAAAQLLIERGKLDLDNPVADYLPAFDNELSKSITVRQVLTHRSGLPLSNLKAPYQFKSLSKQVADAGATGPEFDPGSKFWYSDTGTDVVAALVEKASGELINEFVQREILEPLEMKNSFYGFDRSEERLKSAATLYLRGGPGGWRSFWKPVGNPLYPFAWGSQTLYSTTSDYAKFLNMMMNEGRVGDRQLLSKEAVQRMLEPVSRMTMMGSDSLAPTGFRNLAGFYGQMMVTYREIGKEKQAPTAIGHSGSDGTAAWGWPQRDLMILYFTQSRGGMTALRIEESIDELIIHEGVAEPVPEHLRPYPGIYIANEGKFDNEPFTVKVRNGKLVVDVPSQLAFELMDPDENGFWAFARMPDKIQATFDRNENDEVIGIRLHQGGKITEVPKAGTARAKEMAREKDEKKAAGKKSTDATQESTSATWTGTLTVGSNKLRLELTLVETDGKLTGKVLSPDQNNATFDATEIKFDKERLSFSIPVLNASYSGDLSDDGNTVKGTFVQSGKEVSLTLTNSDASNASDESKDQAVETETLKEAWIGKLEIGGMQPVMQFRIVTLGSGETKAYFDSVTEGATDFDATWSIEGDQLNFDVEEIRLTFRGTLNDVHDRVEGTWSQGGRALPLVLEKSDSVYDSKNTWDNRPQRPVGPFPYDALEVSFENKTDDVILAGTLTVPKTEGKHPVVILISGSGPQDRDESLMEHKPFLVLADYLSRQGIAVLRYDDRGTAESTGNFGKATTEDFARDASAAVEFLKKHSRIKPDQIGLVGHSEGGLIAPMVVGQRNDVAFVVLMAATGVDGKTISLTQSEAMLRANGTPEFSIKVEQAVSKAVMDVVTSTQQGDDISEEIDTALASVIEMLPKEDREEGGKKIREAIEIQKSRLQGRWMRFFLSYDPAPAIKNIKCPVLAITGTKDLQVLPDLNVPKIRQALTDGGNSDFEIVELEGLNHLFQECETGSMSEYATIAETFNPAALKSIGDWIKKRVTLVKE